MKKWKMAGAFIMLCMFMMLGACSNNNNDTSDKKDHKDEKTVSFKADNGTIDVPANPKKVVVLEASYVGYLLQVGIKPVAAQKLALENPYFEGKLDGTEEVTSDALEKILSLKPDLIITGTTDENIKSLQDIAPTVAFEWGKRDYLENMTTIGQLVNKEKEAKEWIAEWNDKVAANKEKVQSAVGDKTVSIMESFSKGVYVFGDNFGRGGEVIYKALGLKAPEAVQKNVIDKSGFAEVSLENIPEYAGDYIFFGSWAGEESSNDKIKNSTVWKSLPAVKAGNVFPLNPKTSYFSDPVTLDHIMDEIVSNLTGK
ncbi:iron-hydroxamate ABC transporter substrate-binding protein [Bacillus testis]|uniref:iron-hydroxamate ABC transporter substrate-binding protein n=1 Tax=Bacillus testis TaxID=1622072 RepID=UPI00067F57E7|nr:iron-hydroxamate ABC transporter substrate-binding protein [Bacillus testis]